MVFIGALLARFKYQVERRLYGAFELPETGLEHDICIPGFPCLRSNGAADLLR
jgi:hypothetical protein